ncbi:MAG: TonB family protein [Acidobacteriia bacterium]|nr:TonB family protein [Terriglobia bacterium]
MTQHADILDTPESLRGSFIAAISLHVSILLAFALYGWLSQPGEKFGDNNPSGGAVAVEMADSIPIPHQGAVNPVANDTESQVPQTPEKAKDQEKLEKPPPDAIKLHNKKAKPKPVEKTAARQIYRPYKDLEKNQLTTRTAQQVSSPLFSAKPGSGTVGTGPNTTLGTRCAGYASQIQTIVARNWRTGDIDARYQTAPAVVSRFDLLRDGSIRNVTILQMSGITTLDDSVKRAILDSNPLPPIPPECNKESAKVEFTFELKR